MLDAPLFSLFSVSERDGLGIDHDKAVKVKEETVSLISNFDIEQLALPESEGGTKLDFKTSL